MNRTAICTIEWDKEKNLKSNHTVCLIVFIPETMNIDKGLLGKVQSKGEESKEKVKPVCYLLAILLP
jgi:hypothetical protein